VKLSSLAARSSPLNSRSALSVTTVYPTQPCRMQQMLYRFPGVAPCRSRACSRLRSWPRCRLGAFLKPLPQVAHRSCYYGVCYPWPRPRQLSPLSATRSYRTGRPTPLSSRVLLGAGHSYGLASHHTRPASYRSLPPHPSRISPRGPGSARTDHDRNSITPHRAKT
jgi:hypothetical protein